MKIPDGVKIHPENDKLYTKKCPECGKAMKGGRHDEMNPPKWAFGCECGNQEWLDGEGNFIGKYLDEN